jgi:hypothetical protein
MSGSIEKYTKNGKDAYMVRYYVTNPETGIRKQKSKSGFPTKKEADRFLTSIKSRIDSKQYIAESRITVREYLDNWLSDVVQPNLKRNTITSHTRYVKNHIIPHLGDIPLQDLTATHIRRLYNQLQKKWTNTPHQGWTHWT